MFSYEIYRGRATAIEREGNNLEKVSKTFARKWLKPGPEYCLDYLMCADFA
jgi:hypothetical protein